MNYSIHSSQSGETLIQSIDLPEDRVETLSSDTAEGHFRADQLDELAALGSVSVYAILL